MNNYLAKAPEVERVFYANLFLQDIQTMYDIINHIQVRYKLEGFEISLEEQEKALDSLMEPISNNYTGEKERVLTDVFQDNEMMRNYIRIAQELRQKTIYLQKEITEEKERIEAEKRESEERKKYETLTEEEQGKKIKELDDAKFDVTQSYKEIIQYEKEVAKAKGLLNQKESMATEDMEWIRIEKSEIYDYLLRAREQGIRISILPDVDEQKENTLVIVPKGVKLKKLPLKLGEATYYGEMEPNHCTYSRNLAYLIQNHCFNKDKRIKFEKKNGSLYAYIKCKDDSDLFGGDDAERLRMILKNIRERIAKEKANGMEEAKFYIQIPYLRPMVPILEELREQGIEYYIPPMDEQTHKYEPTKKIYMDREDLQRYRTKVHERISSLSKGVITIGAEKMNAEELLFGEKETEQR